MINLSSTEIALLCYFVVMTLGLLSYIIIPKKFKWIVLLVLSLSFAIALTSYWTIFLILMIVIAYFSGFLMNKNISSYKAIKDSLDKENKKKYKKAYKKKNKIIVIVSVVLSVLILACLKYFNLPLKGLNDLFIKGSWAITFPILGISYYTLISISYMIDVYREKYQYQSNIFKLALFIGYFPSLLEGPFNRYDDLSNKLYKDTNPTYDNVVNGFMLFVWGIFLKLVIADRLDMITGPIFSEYYKFSSISIFVGVVLYVFKLYFDFMGFVEIGRGISLMFGIELPKNFDFPLLSKSTDEFWRRWHITLGAWFKDYIYYPIALSKPLNNINKKIHGHVPVWFEKILVNIVPLFFVWLACGIWHGAGSKYIVYGMYYFIVIILEMFISALRRKIFKNEHWYLNVIAVVRTLVVITIGMMMFRSSSLQDFFNMFKLMFTSTETYSFIKLIQPIEFRFAVIVLSIVLILNIIKYYSKFDGVYKLNPYLKLCFLIVIVSVVLIYGCYGPNYSGGSNEYAGF